MSCSTNLSNLTPPFRVQGTPTAMNVSGSQASNKLTACSAALAVPTRAGALELAVPSRPCEAEGSSGCGFFPSQATASAATDTRTNVHERIVIGSLWPEPYANPTPCSRETVECGPQLNSAIDFSTTSYVASRALTFKVIS